MRMLNTGAAKYRMRVLYAIKLVRLPQPTVVMVDGIMGVSWSYDNRLITIVQFPQQPSRFCCQTFVRLKTVSRQDVDLEALDGPAQLVEFLDAMANWLA